MERVLILVIVIPLLAAATDILLAHSLIGRRYRWFAAPGVILHELSHALACLLTGAKIKHISLFDKDGGHVEHQQSKIPVLGQVIISIAPIIIGIVALYFLTKLVGINPVRIDSITLSYDYVIDTLREIFRGIDYGSKLNIVLIYLIVSIAITMNPSFQDIKNIALPILVFAISMYFIYRYTDYRPNLDIQVPSNILIVLSTVDIVLIMTLVLSIIMFVLSRLVKPL